MNGLNLARKTSYQLCACTKILEPVTCEISQLEKILAQKFTNPRADFVAWQIQSILWGKFDGKKLSEFTPELWLECRIFNATEELHLKRLDDKFCGRYVRETSGADNFYVDSFSRFWGENSGSNGDFVKLLDRQRKLFMEIPCRNKNSKWYGLLTRNYIDSDATTGLSGYSDYRFVAIEPAGGGTNIG